MEIEFNYIFLKEKQKQIVCESIRLYDCNNSNSTAILLFKIIPHEKRYFFKVIIL